MIRFRLKGLRTLEIAGTDAELELLAQDLKDILDGLGEWVSVTGDAACRGEERARSLEAVIFCTTKEAGALVPASAATIECRLPVPLLQRLLHEVQVRSDAPGAYGEPSYVLDHEVEIQVVCTGEEAA